MRLQELRDVHRLESSSQSDQIESLRKQLKETEALLAAGKATLTSHGIEKSKLQSELTEARNLVKEEEEKRVKAVSLLKSVRQKLVKTEKEKEDAIKDAREISIKEQNAKLRGDTERAEWESKTKRMVADKEREIEETKSKLEREFMKTKSDIEKTFEEVKSRLETDLITAKVVDLRSLVLYIPN